MLVRRIDLLAVPGDATSLTRALAELEAERWGDEGSAGFAPPRSLLSAVVTDPTFDTARGMLLSLELDRFAANLEALAGSDDPWLWEPALSVHEVELARSLSEGNLLGLDFLSKLGLPALDGDGSLAAETRALGLHTPIRLPFAEGPPVFREAIEKGWDAVRAEPQVSLAGVALTLTRELAYADAPARGAPEVAERRRRIATILRALADAKADVLADVAARLERGDEGWTRIPARLDLVVDSRQGTLDLRPGEDGARVTDLAALVWGTSEALATGRTDVEPLLERALRALREDRFDPALGTLLDEGRIRALDAGLALEMLGRAHAVLPGDHPGAATLREIVGAQASFLVDTMSRSSGGFEPAIERDGSAPEVDDTLGDQAAPILGLLRAAQVLGEPGLTRRALEAADHVEDELWDEGLGLYRTRGRLARSGGTQVRRYAYTDVDMAASLAALSEVLTLREGLDRNRSARRLTRFFHRIFEDGGLEQYVRLGEGRPDGPSWMGQVAAQSVARVEIRETRRDTAYPADRLWWWIEVANECPGALIEPASLADIRVVDEPDGDQTYVPGTATLDGRAYPDARVGDDLVWRLRDLGPGERSLMTFQVEVDDSSWIRWVENDVLATGYTGQGQECEAGDEDVEVEVLTPALLEVEVFLDRNEDGRRSPGEPGIPGARVHVDGSRVLEIGADGSSELALPGGEHVVAVDRGSIDPDLRLTTPSTRTVTLADGDRARVELGLASRTRLEGHVFRDLDRDGVRDPDEPALPAVRVEHPRSGRMAYSARDGYVRFDDLPVESGDTAEVGIAAEQPYADDVENAAFERLP